MIAIHTRDGNPLDVEVVVIATGVAVSVAVAVAEPMESGGVAVAASTVVVAEGGAGDASTGGGAAAVAGVGVAAATEGGGAGVPPPPGGKTVGSATCVAVPVAVKSSRVGTPVWYVPVSLALRPATRNVTVSPSLAQPCFAPLPRTSTR